VKFKIDENLPVEIADEIRGLGHEGDTLRKSCRDFPTRKFSPRRRKESAFC
jgi:hypothetical protein